MSVRLMPNGTFEFDTVAEAVEFYRLRGSRNGAVPKHAEPRQRQRQVDRDPAGFIDNLLDFQRRIVDALRGGRLRAEELAERLGTEVSRLGPSLRHLRERAAKYGLDPENIVIRSMGHDGDGKAYSTYELGAELSEQD